MELDVQDSAMGNLGLNWGNLDEFQRLQSGGGSVTARESQECQPEKVPKQRD